MCRAEVLAASLLGESLSFQPFWFGRVSAARAALHGLKVWTAAAGSVTREASILDPLILQRSELSFLADSFHFAFSSLQLVKTSELDPSRNYLFGFHPHGVLVAGAFGNFCTEATGFSQLFPGLTPHLLMLPFWFKVPFFRDYIMSGGELFRGI